MAQSNKIGLVAMASLKAIQNGDCSHCGQKLNAAYDMPLAFGTIRVTDAEMIKTTIAHIMPESKGGKNTLANYTLQHYACNDAYKIHDYAEYAKASGAVCSYDDVINNAKLACQLNAAIISGKAKNANVSEYARQLLGESTEWARRTSPALIAQICD